VPVRFTRILFDEDKAISGFIYGKVRMDRGISRRLCVFCRPTRPIEKERKQVNQTLRDGEYSRQLRYIPVNDFQANKLFSGESWFLISGRINIQSRLVLEILGAPFLLFTIRRPTSSKQYPWFRNLLLWFLIFDVYMDAHHNPLFFDQLSKFVRADY